MRTGFLVPLPRCALVLSGLTGHPGNPQLKARTDPHRGSAPSQHRARKQPDPAGENTKGPDPKIWPLNWGFAA